MRSNPLLPLLFALLFLISSGLAHSQVEASAYRNTLPFSIGVGASNFNVDWGHNRMYAVTLWADWHPARVPSMLRGVGLGIEGHDLNYGRPSTLASNFRQDTALGGPTYTLPRFRDFRPYGKFFVGFGSYDFNTGRPGPYHHDTRTLYEVGGGFDYRVWNHVFVRADYSYQDWGSLFLGKNRHPQGVSLGAVYDFRTVHRH